MTRKAIFAGGLVILLLLGLTLILSWDRAPVYESNVRFVSAAKTEIDDIAVSPDGKTIAGADVSGDLALVSVERASLIRRYNAHEVLYTVAYTGPSTVAIGGMGVRVYEFDLSTGSKTPLPRPAKVDGDMASKLSYCAQDGTLAYATDGHLTFIAATTAGLARGVTIDERIAGPGTVNATACVAPRRIFVGTTNGVGIDPGLIYGFDPVRGKTIWWRRTPYGVSSIAVSRDGSRVVAGLYNSGQALIFDGAGKHLGTYELPSFLGFTYAAEVAIDDERGRIYVVGTDLVCLDLRTLKKLFSVKIDHHMEHVRIVSGTELAFVDYDDRTRIGLIKWSERRK